MRSSQKKQTASVALAILGAAMLFLGITQFIMPPILTAIGFFIMAWVFYGNEKGRA